MTRPTRLETTDRTASPNESIVRDSEELPVTKLGESTVTMPRPQAENSVEIGNHTRYDERSVVSSESVSITSPVEDG